MKLWEVMKALEENPGKEFETAGREWKLYANGNNYLYLERYSCGIRLDRTSGAGGFNGNFRAYDAYDWQEVKTPVTWQEAFTAWTTANKTIAVVYLGRKYIFRGERSILEDDRYENSPISKTLINHGTWYIEED